MLNRSLNINYILTTIFSIRIHSFFVEAKVKSKNLGDSLAARAHTKPTHLNDGCVFASLLLPFKLQNRKSPHSLTASNVLVSALVHFSHNSYIIHSKSAIFRETSETNCFENETNSPQFSLKLAEKKQ